MIKPEKSFLEKIFQPALEDLHNNSAVKGAQGIKFFQHERHTHSASGLHNPTAHLRCLLTLAVSKPILVHWVVAKCTVSETL